MQIIELLWNMLELAPGTAQQAMSAAAASSVPQTQQLMQQIEQQRQVQGSSDEPPWQLAATAAAPADIWVRQSCSPSCTNSRPTTSMPPVDLQQTGTTAAAASGSQPDSTHTAGEDCAAAAPRCNAAAAELVEVLGCFFKQQLQVTSSKQVMLRLLDKCLHACGCHDIPAGKVVTGALTLCCMHLHFMLKGLTMAAASQSHHRRTCAGLHLQQCAIFRVYELHIVS
jgi:hypothetical protein